MAAGTAAHERSETNPAPRAALLLPGALHSDGTAHQLGTTARRMPGTTSNASGPASCPVNHDSPAARTAQSTYIAQPE